MTLLLILFFCHFLADYTHLSTGWMLDAKRFGKPLLPIAAHAGMHTLIMFIGITIYFAIINEGEKQGLHFLLQALPLQFVSHFLIDVWKGRMNGWFPSLQKPTNKGHWYIFGFDQYLHAVVIIIMFNLLTK